MPLIQLCPPQQGSKNRIIIDLILDFNQQGDLIGIEIINLKFHAGPQVLDLCDSRLPKLSPITTYSYDADSDAFYLALSREHSAEQRVIEGSLILDRQGRLVEIEVPEVW